MSMSPSYSDENYTNNKNFTETLRQMGSDASVSRSSLEGEKARIIALLELKMRQQGKSAVAHK